MLIMSNQVTGKSVGRIFFEAVIVGGLLVVIVYMLKSYLMQFIPKITTDGWVELLFVAGFIFHILFEYTGLNLKYALEYCDIYKQN